MPQNINYAQITRRLLAAGYTTKRLGVAVGLPQPSISRLANGKTHSVSADVGVALIRLAGGTVVLPELIAAEGAPAVPVAATEVSDAS
jgi:predicted XRE-type DNA-binding protein